MTLRSGSIAEQSFNAVERVDEYCHLPEEAPYEHTPAAAAAAAGKPGGGGSGNGSSKRQRRRRTGSPNLQEPLLPVTSGGPAAAAGQISGSSITAAAAAAGVVNASWPEKGAIEFFEVMMRWADLGGVVLILAVFACGNNLCLWQ
jgi:hypothetical protein